MIEGMIDIDELEKNEVDPLEEIFQWYEKQADKNSQEQIKNMLTEIQELRGAINQGLQERVANCVGAKLSTIKTIIKHSSNLKAADYKYEVTACSGPRCGAKGGANIITAIRKELNPNDEGISEDGLFLLKTRSCLKQCLTSPNMIINDTVYRELTPEKATSIIRELRSK